ncbi:MAG TPA: C40 family peptidase [Puia sp.]|nr:C40 family peptidase [Puia sp.]
MLKTTLFVAAFALLAAGCSSSRPVVSRQSSSGAAATATSSRSPQFIENISVNPSGKEQRSGPSVGAAAPGERGTNSPAASGSIENISSAQFKFAILLNAPVEDLNDPKLLSFMEYWYGAPYRYGGTSRDGIDCSAFASLLMSSVFGAASLPRTSKAQYLASRHIHRDELQEGDLVFFHTLGRRRSVTHVGVYLRNDKFIHASLSGVTISDLNENYYSRHYVGAGRVLIPGTDDAATAGGAR